MGVDGEICLSVENQSWSWVRVDACSVFSFCHYFCVFKDLKVSSNTAAVVLLMYCIVVYVRYRVGA
jgi:hypothetical protein